MFNEGDRVVVRKTGAFGTVTYVEDGYYAVELDNGVEQDFEDSAALVKESEYERPIPKSYSKALGSSNQSRYSENEADRVLEAMTKSNRVLVEHAERAVIRKGVDYDGLGTSEKVRELAAVLNVPEIVLYGAVDGEGVVGSDLMDKVLQKAVQSLSIEVERDS